MSRSDELLSCSDCRTPEVSNMNQLTTEKEAKSNFLQRVMAAPNWPSYLPGNILQTNVCCISFHLHFCGSQRISLHGINLDQRWKPGMK